MSAAEGCPFTARLLKTFVDESAFHLLQDPILGGELFNRVLAAPNVSISRMRAFVAPPGGVPLFSTWRFSFV